MCYTHALLFLPHTHALCHHERPSTNLSCFRRWELGNFEIIRLFCFHASPHTCLPPSPLALPPFFFVVVGSVLFSLLATLPFYYNLACSRTFRPSSCSACSCNRSQTMNSANSSRVLTPKFWGAAVSPQSLPFAWRPFDVWWRHQNAHIMSAWNGLVRTEDQERPRCTS